eukprot:CAMPEP_0176099520 /NCGR_PEP_ID=MMETSP0120_2-20121206/49909_1 /TAXON_ID=160619 /ORGANISM="Kryptoperidinium foliaceum, Strain CCMP 1326" /LENGTH=115 /DNA_ID=CAMNT_0017433551 /DNA_START=1 /DNA_END=344 /DNA_ORIENTATION=-
MNAFERLLGRALFDEPWYGHSDGESSGSEREAERPWNLLKALLAQNAQARGYAQRLLAQRAKEEPESLTKHADAPDRLRSLLDLWPAEQRQSLATSWGLSPEAGTAHRVDAPVCA